MANIVDTLVNLPELIGFAQLFVLVLGVAVGIFLGALPGIGPLLGTVMAIPFTFRMDPVSSLALLIGIYQGGSYGGALSATIIGIPGTPMSAATMLDARPMAVGGRASEAVTISTIGSSFGGVVSALMLIAVAPSLATIALKFGPAETAAFALLGLTTLGALAGSSPVRGWLMGMLGLWIATIGLDPVTGVSRFTFGSVYLDGGLTLIPLLVGLFGISEVLMQLEKPVRAHDATSNVAASVAAFRSVILRPINYLRSSLIGVFIGVLPGVGGVSASFLAYRLSMVFRKRQDPDFGQGNPDGVVASESANSAVTGGALIPMLALSIPGDPIVAVLMGGLMLQGIAPGPRMFLNHPEIVQGIFAVFLIGAVFLLPIGLLFIRAVVPVLRLPQWSVMAAVIMISIVGTYSVSRQILDLGVLLVFGAVGYLLRKGNYPLSPVVVGFVLGPIFESNYRRTGLISQGDMLGYIATRPITMLVLAGVAVAILVPLIKSLRPARPRLAVDPQG